MAKSTSNKTGLWVGISLAVAIVLAASITAGILLSKSSPPPASIQTFSAPDPTSEYLDAYMIGWLNFLNELDHKHDFNCITNYHYNFITANNFKNLRFNLILDGEPNNLHHLTLPDNSLLVTTKRDPSLLPRNINANNTFYVPYWAFYYREANAPQELVQRINELFERRISRQFSPEQFKRAHMAFFGYSNCNQRFQGVRFREQLYYKLKELVPIDNGGKCAGGSPMRGDFMNNLHLFARYKFVLAIENSPINGYTSEKLLNPILAGAIPIYYGDPTVDQVFNPKRFINLRDYIRAGHEQVDLHALAARMLHISNDYDEYLKIVREPVFVDDTFLLTQTWTDLKAKMRARITEWRARRRVPN